MNGKRRENGRVRRRERGKGMQNKGIQKRQIGRLRKQIYHKGVVAFPGYCWYRMALVVLVLSAVTMLMLYGLGDIGFNCPR